jgi:hypothetical protein
MLFGDSCEGSTQSQNRSRNVLPQRTSDIYISTFFVYFVLLEINNLYYLQRLKTKSCKWLIKYPIPEFPEKGKDFKFLSPYCLNPKGI